MRTACFLAVVVVFKRGCCCVNTKRFVGAEILVAEAIGAETLGVETVGAAATLSRTCLVGATTFLETTGVLVDLFVGGDSGRKIINDDARKSAPVIASALPVEREFPLTITSLFNL